MPLPASHPSMAMRMRWRPPAMPRAVIQEGQGIKGGGRFSDNYWEIIQGFLLKPAKMACGGPIRFRDPFLDFAAYYCVFATYSRDFAAHGRDFATYSRDFATYSRNSAVIAKYIHTCTS